MNQSLISEIKFSIFGKNKKKEQIKCGFCGGRGVINGYDGDEMRCLKCFGEGYKIELKPMSWQIVSELTIGQIKVLYRGKSKGIKTQLIQFDNFGPQSELYEEEYMAYESGIGSGTLYKAGTLFLSRNDAQLKCDELNGKDN